MDQWDPLVPKVPLPQWFQLLLLRLGIQCLQ